MRSSSGKTSWKRSVAEWLGMIAVGAVMLFFFAPESWWQFGVFPESERKQGADFTLREFRGNDPWNLAGRRGKIVVVNYWATWCGPCRIETPGLVDLAAEFSGQEVEFVGVTVDEDLDAVERFANDYAVSYPILLPGDDPNLGPGDMRLPTTFLYDREGRIAKRYSGLVLESTLRSDIRQLLE